MCHIRYLITYTRYLARPRRTVDSAFRRTEKHFVGTMEKNAQKPLRTYVSYYTRVAYGETVRQRKKKRKEVNNITIIL